MSFILDALRKSEHERQRQTGPALVETPVAAVKPKSNTWAVAAIALLVVNLVAIGVLLLLKSRDDSPTAAAPASGSPAPIAAAAPPATSAPAPAPAAQASITQTAPVPAPAPPPPMLRPAAEPAPANGGNPLEREMASGVPGMDSEAAAAAAAPPPGPAAVQSTRRGSVVYQELPEAGPMTDRQVAASASTNTDNLPTADELAGRGVPEMKLELHFYSNRPQERFVFVNGRRYREGDTTADGFQVVEITADGVVMSQGGNRFLLPRP
jgi:general secretion pathway protein B